MIAEESRKKLSELEDKVEVAEEKPLDEEARQQMDEANKKLSDLLSGK